MKTPFLAGQSIYLRPLEPEDLSGPYLQWINDFEGLEFLDGCIMPTNSVQLREYYDKVMRSCSDIMFAVVEKKSGKHIGNAKLTKIDWIHREASYGRLIGDRKARGKGYGQEVLSMLIEYAFNTLNLNRLYTVVVEDNAASIKSNEKAGMQQEGILKQARYINGTYRNMIYFGLTREQYLENVEHKIDKGR